MLSGSGIYSVQRIYCLFTQQQKFGPQPRQLHNALLLLSPSFAVWGFPWRFVAGRFLYTWKAMAHPIVPLLSSGSCFFSWAFVHICVQLVRDLQARPTAYTRSLTDWLACWHIAWASMASVVWPVACSSACIYKDNNYGGRVVSNVYKLLS